MWEPHQIHHCQREYSPPPASSEFLVGPAVSSDALVDPEAAGVVIKSADKLEAAEDSDAARRLLRIALLRVRRGMMFWWLTEHGTGRTPTQQQTCGRIRRTMLCQNDLFWWIVLATIRFGSAIRQFNWWMEQWSAKCVRERHTFFAQGYWKTYLFIAYLDRARQGLQEPYLILEKIQKLSEKKIYELLYGYLVMADTLCRNLIQAPKSIQVSSMMDHWLWKWKERRRRFDFHLNLIIRVCVWCGGDSLESRIAYHSCVCCDVRGPETQEVLEILKKRSKHW